MTRPQQINLLRILLEDTTGEKYSGSFLNECLELADGLGDILFAKNLVKNEFNLNLIDNIKKLHKAIDVDS
jgi:hypothetical protein